MLNVFPKIDWIGNKTNNNKIPLKILISTNLNNKNKAAVACNGPTIR